MNVEHAVPDEDLLRTELARTEAERARAESIVERLKSELAAQRRAATKSFADLQVTVAQRDSAMEVSQLALQEIEALREMWAHVQVRLDDERSARIRELGDFQRARNEWDARLPTE